MGARLIVADNRAAGDWNVKLRPARTTDQITYESGTPVEFGEGGGGGTSDPTQILTTAAITIVGGAQGSYADGAVIPAGTPIQTILTNMLRTRVVPTYTAPTISLSSSGAKTVESGSTINSTHTPTWTKNDAGNLSQYRLLRNGAPVYTGASATAQADNYGVLVDATLSYQAEATYNEGAIKNDNLGSPYATGHIAAGTITSAAVAFTAVRKMFWGISDTVDTSAAIRALSNSLLGPVAGSTGAITRATGGQLVIAYPATLRDITYLGMLSLGYVDITDLLVKTTVTVEGASAGCATSYKVFTYTPAGSFTDASFQFTI